MAATGSHNPRGGTVSVHTKARMWDRLMVEALQHGGLRALTYGDGTLIVYDPVLTAEDADTALPEWLTGHPAVTSYPLKPLHATGADDPRGALVYRLPGLTNHEQAEYDPISLAPLRHECEVCADYGEQVKAGVTRVTLQVRGQRLIAHLCPHHKRDALAAQEVQEAEYVRRLALTPEERAAEDVENLQTFALKTPYTFDSVGSAVRQCGWYSTCKEPAARYPMQIHTHRATVLLCDAHVGMARTFLRAIGGSLGDKLPD